LLGLLGKSASQPVITGLTKAAPGSVRQIVLNAMVHLQHSHAAAGILAAVGIVVGLWSASSYVAGFMRAFQRPSTTFPRAGRSGRPRRYGLPSTPGHAGPAGRFRPDRGGDRRASRPRWGHALGIGSAAVTAWNIAKWPVLLIIVSIMFAILYWASPNARHGFKLVSPGSVLAVVLWLIASGTVRALRGPLRELQQGLRQPRRGDHLPDLDVDLEHRGADRRGVSTPSSSGGAAIAGGLPPDQEPFTELRDTRKLPGE